MSEKQPPLPNLTSLRFFAAMMVVLLHAEAWRWVSVANPLHRFLENGYTGVSIFFVLSGFVLSYNHLAVPNVRNFYVLRLARVYPLHVLAMVWMIPFSIHTALVITHNRSIFLEIPFALLLLQTYPMALQLNVPSWTLTIEVFFYLFFPFVIPWVVRNRGRLWLCIPAIYIVFLIPPVILHLPFTSPKGAQWLGSFCMLPIARAGEFLVGMFAGVAFRHRRPIFHTWIAISVVVLTIATFYLEFTYLPHEVVRNIGMAFPYAVMIYVLAGWPSRLLASAPMQFAGEISYSIYLLQYPLGHSMRYFNRNMPFLIYFGVLCGVSSLSYLYFEKPVRRWVLKVAGVRAPAKPLPTPAQIP